MPFFILLYTINHFEHVDVSYSIMKCLDVLFQKYKLIFLFFALPKKIGIPFLWHCSAPYCDYMTKEQMYHIQSTWMTILICKICVSLEFVTELSKPN
jgi:hypothetical protein